MAQCATTALAGAVPRLCVRGARGRFGGLWRAVPSRCPLPSLAGTPFHAVCAFRELDPVVLLVVPACPLRVCELALPRRPLPPPLGGVLCAPRAVPAPGAGRAVPRGPCPSVCPAPVPCSVWCDCGGAVWSRFPPTWLGVAGGCPRGGLVCRCCEGGLMSGAVPPPAARPLGRAAGVPRPVCSGCGRCGRGDPAPVPQRARLQAGVVRCGAGGRASPGGVPPTVVRGV